jgi:hypothetical protein
MNRQESPANAAKALPKVKHLMFPVFSFFVRHESVGSEDCADSLADHFRLSQTQRTECGNGYEPRFNKCIEFVFNILSGKAGLVEQIGKHGSRNRYRLTRKGKEWRLTRNQSSST